MFLEKLMPIKDYPYSTIVVVWNLDFENLREIAKN